MFFCGSVFCGSVFVVQNARKYADRSFQNQRCVAADNFHRKSKMLVSCIAADCFDQKNFQNDYFVQGFLQIKCNSGQLKISDKIFHPKLALGYTFLRSNTDSCACPNAAPCPTKCASIGNEPTCLVQKEINDSTILGRIPIPPGGIEYLQNHPKTTSEARQYTPNVY